MSLTAQKYFAFIRVVGRLYPGSMLLLSKPQHLSVNDSSTCAPVVLPSTLQLKVFPPFQGDSNKQPKQRNKKKTLSNKHTRKLTHTYTQRYLTQIPPGDAMHNTYETQNNPSAKLANGNTNRNNKNNDSTRKANTDHLTSRPLPLSVAETEREWPECP